MATVTTSWTEPNPKERLYTSDAEAWAVFVGDITPEEFVKPFLKPFLKSDPIDAAYDPVDAAIKDHMSDWGWEEEPPSWLEYALDRYIWANILKDYPTLQEHLHRTGQPFILLAWVLK